MQEKSRKILILATSYLPLIGGAELAVKDLTDRLPDFSFDLVTSRSFSDLPEAERIGNVNIFRVGNQSAKLNLFLPKNFLPLAIFFKARQLLSLNNYDLVYVLQASQAGGAGWLLKTLGIIKQPLVINFQEGKDFSTQSVLVRLARRLIIGSADYFVVISNYLRDFLISQGVDGGRIFLLPNGVNNPGMIVSDQDLKNSLGLGGERIVITISRLVQKNGIADLVKAMPFVKNNLPEPVKLVIVGGAEPDISLEEDLKNLTKNMDLTSSVLFVGPIDHSQVYKYLSIADVFVRPSLSEGLGTAFLEAMAVGVPIIGTRVGGIVDFIEEGQTGLFCETGDSEDIGRKIVQILSNPELRNRLSENGQRLVKEKYGWDFIAKEFKNIYGIITKN